jgi:hypothetical protein
MTVGGAAALVKARKEGRLRDLFAIAVNGESGPLLEVCGGATAVCTHMCAGLMLSLCRWQCKREEDWQAVLPFIRMYPEVSSHGRAEGGDGASTAHLPAAVLLQSLSVGQPYEDSWYERADGDDDDEEEEVRWQSVGTRPLLATV